MLGVYGVIVNFIYVVKWLYLLKRNYVLLQFSHCFKAYILSLYYQHTFYLVALNSMYSFFSHPVYAYVYGEIVVSSCVPRADSWKHALQLSRRCNSL